MKRGLNPCHKVFYPPFISVFFDFLTFPLVVLTLKDLIIASLNIYLSRHLFKSIFYSFLTSFLSLVFCVLRRREKSPKKRSRRRSRSYSPRRRSRSRSYSPKRRSPSPRRKPQSKQKAFTA